MCLGEILWRVKEKMRDAKDRLVMPLRQTWFDPYTYVQGNGQWRQGQPMAIGSHWPSASDLTSAAPYKGTWKSALVARADKLCENRIDLFDLEDLDLGRVINWNYEYKAKKACPMGFAPRIDYRDYSITGDCKFVWELSRHQHLVVLGRAYRVTGKHCYAETVVDQLADWMRQCPYGLGMNWRSPLELAIRIINWVWALELIRPADIAIADRLPSLPQVVYRHLWDIQRKYSQYSSANNHLVGEAAGVFIGTSYFRDFKQADAWRKRSRDILAREIIAQTYADGAHREQAMGYHLFVLEFFLLAGLVARQIGEDFPASYWQCLSRMFEFVGAFTEGGGNLPMFGDCDDGYVLDLGTKQVPGFLSTAAVVFERGDFKVWSDKFREPTFWLLGPNSRQCYQNIDTNDVDNRIRSRAFPESGHYLLQTGHRDDPDRISVSFHCGDLGFGPIAAHGHADSLSMTLRAFGKDVLIDPGTYDYFTYPNWRDYFRSTQAHNTVEIDGQDQSEMLGSFLWGRRAHARCIQWEPTEQGGSVSAEHDGYRYLPGSVRHRRTIHLDGICRELTIQDELTGAGTHEAVLYYHWAQGCHLEKASPNKYRVDVEGETATIQLDPRLHTFLGKGQGRPIIGWSSRNYHRKTPSWTLSAQCHWHDCLTMTTKLML